MAYILSGINPVAFRVGSLEVRWYGIILTTAMVLGLFLLLKMSKKKDISSDDSLELFLWIIPLAVVFARILYVIANNNEYGYFPIESWDDFVNCIAIWDGGITIYGGILGGIIGAFIWSKRKKKSLGATLDMVAPIMLLGQSLGRWGNFFNQEAYGMPVNNPSLQTFPFAVYIDGGFGVQGGWYQATFFYESVFNFGGAVLFYYLWKKNKVDGALVPLYLVWYCVIRLILDFLRVDGLLITKIACAVIIPVGVVGGLLYYFRGIKKLDHDRVVLEVQQLLEEDD